MPKRFVTVALAILLLTLVGSALYNIRSVPPFAKQRGVSWVAGDSVTIEDFQPLIENHVNWIVQTPFGWQESYNSPHVALVTDGRILWGERDVGLKTTTVLAKAARIKTLLKPHIWLSDQSNGKWRGEIEMNSEADWQKWFASYREFILHYARLAEENGIEALSIGTELRLAATLREQDWRDLIREIRKVYSGFLTYAANWYLEFEEVKFWDMLDFIGIQAYFPLSDTTRPTLDQVMAGWIPHKKIIDSVRTQYKKPVVFTEIGYRSAIDSAIEPWRWPSRPLRPATPPDLETQSVCYEAFFRTFWNEDWCAGAYFWKWFPRIRNSTRAYQTFTPQNKPAEKVMAKWYRMTGD